MKRTLGLGIALVAVALGTNALAANFGSNHLVIYRLGGDASGNTAATLTNRGNIVWLDEYTTNGTFVQSHMMPTNYFGANSPLIDSGTAFGNGLITRSVDGRFILVTGFGATINQFTISLGSTYGTDAPRVIGLVDGNGHIDTTTTQTNSFVNGEQLRSACSTDGTNLWFSGDGSGGAGVRYTTRGLGVAANFPTIANIRQLNIFNNQLYFSTFSGSTSVNVVTNNVPGTVPTTTTNAVVGGLNGLTNLPSPWAFVMFKLHAGGADPLDTLYVADGTAYVVWKFSLSGGIWNNVGSIESDAVVGMTGKTRISGSTTNVDLWMTGGGGTLTGGTLLYAATDPTGYNADPGSGVTAFFPLAAATTNVSFRGIAFAPVGGETLYTDQYKISVGPLLDIHCTGSTGCTPTNTYTYSVANFGYLGPMAWETGYPDWVTLTPHYGSIPPNGGSLTVTVSFNANAAGLSAGTNSDTIWFCDSSDPGDCSYRQVQLVVYDQNVNPTTDFDSLGQVGGPFSPVSKTYTVYNGSTPITLVMNNTPTATWLSFSATNIALAGCTSTNITISIDTNAANGLAQGNYTSAITFSNATAGTVIDTGSPINAQLAVGGLFFCDDFSTFTQNANLAGQNGWVSHGGSLNEPYVTNNAVYVPAYTGGASGDEPYKNIPVTSNGYVYAGMLITVTSAPPSSVSAPSRMTCFFQRQNESGYAVDYLSVRDVGTNTGQFVFCARNPFTWVFDTTPRTYGVPYRVIIQADPGITNMYVWINPASSTINTNVADIDAYNASDTGADWGLGSFSIQNTFSSFTGVTPGFFCTKICISTNYADVYNFLGAPGPGSSNATLIWTNGSDFWQSTTAWITNGTGGTGGFPGAGDNAFFTNAATYSVTLNNDVLNIQSNFFSNAAYTIATVTLNLGAYELNPVYTGTTPGAFLVGDGLNSTTIVYLASSTVPGKGLVVPGRIVVGRNGIGTLFVTNGNVLVGNTVLGNGTGGRGTLVLSGMNTTWINTNIVTVGSHSNSLGCAVVISNWASMAVSNLFRLGSGSSNGGSSNNTLLLDSNARLFTTAPVTIGHTSGAPAPSDNNTATVQGGAVWDNGNASFVIGSADGGTATGNMLRIMAGSFVTNISYLTITAGNTLDLQGGSIGVSTMTNSGTVQGCGTINGNVVVDSGGTVLANCGGTTLNFTGSVANHGNIIATGGTVLRFYGPVLNTGLIDGSGGDVQFFSGVNNVGSGVILTPTNSWTDGSDKWETSTNWSHGTAPSSTDDADLITNAGNNTVTIDATTAGSFPGTMTIRNLTVSAPGIATNTLFLNNAGTNTPLQVLGVLQLGTNGAMVVNNSAVLGTNSVRIGNSSPSSSLVVSNGGSLIVTNGSGTGNVVVNGGSLILGVGTFKTDNLIVTNGGVVQQTQTYQVDNGSITIASGTSQFGSNLVVGGSANSTGAVTVTSGSLVATNASTVIASNGVGSVIISSNATMLSALTSLAIGSNSTASLSIQGSASMIVSSNLTAGSGAGATGIVSVTGGQLVVSNGVLGVGNNGTYTDGSGVGHMTVSSQMGVSNATVIAQSIVLGNNRGGKGSLTIGLGGVVHILPGALGGLASGVHLNDLTLDGGYLDSEDNDVYAGYGIPGEMIISNGTAMIRSAFVGNDNTGSLSMSGGAMGVLSNLVVGMNAAGTGVVMITGGSLTATNGVIGVGNDGTSTNGLGVGTMAVSNGTVTATSILLGSSAGGRGEMTLDEGGSIASAGTNAVLICNDFGQVGGDLSWTNIGSAMYCGYAHPGAYALSNGTASCQDFYVGYDNAGTMTIAGGTMTILSGLLVGQLSGPVATGAVWITSGQLTMVNQPAIIGNSGVGQMSMSNGIVTAADMFVGNSSSNPGTLTLAGGTLTVNGIVLTNPSSQFIFSGGWLNANAITNANGQVLTVGNGVASATLNLLGGISSLGNGLHVSANATLTGCGTINGNVTIDSGGTVLANCGALTFAGIVTNNGTMRANSGSALESYGTVVNNSTIDIINGATNFPGRFVNNGTVLTASSVKISQMSKSGQGMVIQIPSVTGHTYQLQYTTSLTPPTWTPTGASQSGNGGALTFTDSGGAANPQRFYRVAVTAP